MTLCATAIEATAVALRGDPLGAATSFNGAEVAKASPTQASRTTGLGWLSFFCANLQTGFGPFIAAYLTSAKWTQTDIGLVLMIGGLIGLLGQIPGGALVDSTRHKTVLAGVAIALIGLAALLISLSSRFLLILFAWTVHALASCILTPTIATISLALVGHGAISRRLGRNATCASLGSALAAAGMGIFGDYVSSRSVFFVTAALAIPSMLALLRIGPVAPAALGASLNGVASPYRRSDIARDLRGFTRERPLVVLCAAMAMFFLANAAMLPLIGSMLTLRAARGATMLIAACIIVPQIMVAVLSPAVGALAQRWGRRPLLLIGLAALPIKGLCLGLATAPALLVGAQCLDGVASAVIGVVVPLIAADATQRRGHYALAQGVLGTAMAFGAAFSSTIAGVLTDRFGSQTAFLGLSAIAVAAFVIALLAMSESRPAAADTMPI